MFLRNRALDIGSNLTKSYDKKIFSTLDFFKNKNIKDILKSYDIIALSSKYVIYFKRKYPYKDIKKIKKLIFTEIKTKFEVLDFIVFIYREKEDKLFTYHIFFIDKSLLDDNLKNLIEEEKVFLDILGVINGFSKIIKNYKKSSFILGDLGNSKLNIFKVENGRLVDFKKYLLLNKSKDDILEILKKENVEFLIGGKAKDFNFKDIKVLKDPLFFIVNNLKENKNFFKLSLIQKRNIFEEYLVKFSFLFLSFSIIFFSFGYIYKLASLDNTSLLHKQFRALFNKPFQEVFFLTEKSKINYYSQAVRYVLNDTTLENYNKFIDFLNKNNINFTEVNIDKNKIYIKFYVEKDKLKIINKFIKILKEQEDKDKLYIEGILK